MKERTWDKDKAAAASIEWAKGAMKLLDKAAPFWQTAYLRFHSEPGHYGVSGSYVSEGQVKILSALGTSGLFAFTEKAGLSLRKALGVGEREVFVGLLAAHKATRDYKVDFEFKDVERWRITKLDGGTGLPIGL